MANTNVNIKFITVWLYVILAILGIAAFAYGVITLFTEVGNEIPRIAAAVAGALLAFFAGRRAIKKDKDEE